MSSPQTTLDLAPGAEVTEQDTQSDQCAEASEEGEQSSQGPFLSVFLVPGPMRTHKPEGLKAELGEKKREKGVREVMAAPGGGTGRTARGQQPDHGAAKPRVASQGGGRRHAEQRKNPIEGHFPGLVLKTLNSQHRGHGFHPCSRNKILQAAWPKNKTKQNRREDVMVYHQGRQQASSG